MVQFFLNALYIVPHNGFVVVPHAVAFQLDKKCDLLPDNTEGGAN